MPIVNINDVFPRNEAPFQFELGTLVEIKDFDFCDKGEETEINVKGTARLWIVQRYRDSDGTPLYSLSTHNILPPKLVPDGAIQVMRHKYFCNRLYMGHTEEGMFPLKQDTPRTWNQFLDEISPR